MAGDSPPEAVANFIEPIRNAVACFVHHGIPVTADAWTPYQRGILTINDGAPTSIGKNATIQASMRYRIVEDDTKGPWKVRTGGWVYVLEMGDFHAEYHWHPISNSHVKRPHVHINRERTHYPTGRVMLEDVFDLALDRGLKGIDLDLWADVSAHNRRIFPLGASWGAQTADDVPDEDFWSGP